MSTFTIHCRVALSIEQVTLHTLFNDECEIYASALCAWSTNPNLLFGFLGCVGFYTHFINQKTGKYCFETSKIIFKKRRKKKKEKKRKKKLKKKKRKKNTGLIFRDFDPATEGNTAIYFFCLMYKTGALYMHMICKSTFYQFQRHSKYKNSKNTDFDVLKIKTINFYSVKFI